MRVLLLLAAYSISVHASTTKLEKAVQTCSQFGDGSPFMDCIRKFPMHSAGRRNCLNRQGLPQLDICGDPKMGVHEVVRCFTGAAADEKWEKCVVKEYLPTVPLTKLEKAVRTCSRFADDSPFMGCMRNFSMHSHGRRHCVNVLGLPQLAICGDPKKSVPEVVKCFTDAAADENFEECVVKEYLPAAVPLTNLEKAFVLCTDIAKKLELVRCVTKYPVFDVGRRDCLNRNGWPQLGACGRSPGDPKEWVLRCFLGFSAEKSWKECVASELTGVYTTFPMECAPALDAKYVSDLRKAGSSAKKARDLILFFKQGKIGETRRGFEFLKAMWSSAGTPLKTI